jgi:hypothetical protein
LVAITNYLVSVPTDVNEDKTVVLPILKVVAVFMYPDASKGYKKPILFDIYIILNIYYNIVT